MNGPPEMRSPAPCVNMENRAGIVRSNNVIDTTEFESSEAFAVAFVARRYRLAPPLARVICGLAQIGGRFA